MSAIRPGTRPVRVVFQIKDVVVSMDEQAVPQALAAAFGSRDLGLPPLTLTGVRVSAAEWSQTALLGMSRIVQVIVWMTVSSRDVLDRDLFLRAVARGLFATMTLSAPRPAWWEVPQPLPRDGFWLYQRLSGQVGPTRLCPYADVTFGASTVQPAAPSQSPAPTAHTTVTPEVAVGGRAEWQLSRREVERYQTILYNLGELGAERDVDGLIGPTTRIALREFQFVYNRRQNDPDNAARLWSPRSLSVDGILGPETRRALDNFASYRRRPGSIDGWASL